MIISLLESTMRTAIDLDENKKEDGSINWNFVDADSYMECKNLFRSDKEFYDAFDSIGDKIFAEQNGVDAFGNQLELNKG
jgi:hypothetical protein|tara:strand:- start:34 stop:273 length:240 start_codon:yes stop_codon:yes gene_type:complete